MFRYSGLPSMDFCSFFDTPWFGELHKKDLKLRPFNTCFTIFPICSNDVSDMKKNSSDQSIGESCAGRAHHLLVVIFFGSHAVLETPAVQHRIGQGARGSVPSAQLGRKSTRILFGKWPVDVLNMFTREFLSLSVQMMFLSNFQGHSSIIFFFFSPRWVSRNGGYSIKYGWHWCWKIRDFI